ncbi:MAG TPA: M23 family metallopeptidase [Limnochordia bacterium]|nr:M23 family metallopeptidase [Limnochordia bacterium]
MTRKCWLLALGLLIALLHTGCLPPGRLGSEPPDHERELWLVDGFDFPVGDRNGRGWAVTGYDFLDWSSYSNSYHPGEDWNIPGAGNGDQGEPVYAVAHGEVVFSGWNTALGNVILIKHAITPTDFVWSQYAHLAERYVDRGERVYRRQPIGTVGRGPNNTFAAHLHFELRKADLPANAWPRTNGVPWSRSKVADFWLHPSAFINLNRPQ